VGVACYVAGWWWLTAGVSVAPLSLHPLSLLCPSAASGDKRLGAVPHCGGVCGSCLLCG